jgi:uncharacterized membrane protein (UPF0127 family)
MPTRARLAVAVAIALLSATGIAVLAVHRLAGDASARLPRGVREANAVAPFAGYREARVEIDGRCVRVVVADTAPRRERGLRGSASLGPYAGMLFAQPHDSRVAFTMAGVTTPLQIGWYTGAGALVHSSAMRPCPHGSAARCPEYAAGGLYRFGLETPPGPSPDRLLPCA